MRKGLKTLIAGIVLVLLGLFVIPAVILLAIFLPDHEDLSFQVPGQVEISVEEPGNYYLWNDYVTFFEGKSYRRSEEIPDGLAIGVQGEDGKEVVFHRNSSVTLDFGDRQQRSVGYVSVADPGTLLISVSGNFEPRIFSFSRSRLFMFFGLIFGGVGASILLSILGVGVSIWGVVKLAKNPPPNEVEGS